jgi:hypothetical protein
MIVRLLLSTVLLIAAPSASAITYTFTKIADSSGPLGIMADGPAINSKGEVAFQAPLDAGGQGIFRGDGGPLTTIASGSSTYPQFTIRPSISDSGLVAYVRTISASSSRVEVSDGTSTTIVADSTGPNFATFIGWPRINDNNVVAFAATRDGGGTGVFTATSTAAFSTIVQTGFTGISPNITFSNTGKVAFRGNSPSTGGWAIFAANGAVTTPIATVAGPYSTFAGNASINDDGWVTFRATLDGQTVDHLFKSNGGPAIDITDTNGPYSFAFIPAINNSGLVAFRASLDNGTSGIFTGPDPQADKVIVSGDPLDGSTVQTATIHNDSLNDNGQIAFRATLADGRFGIYRADPIVCIADLNNSGAVDVDDLLTVINNWGMCKGDCPPSCEGDVNTTCAVDVDDLLTIINAWGPCQ